ncbi:MAG: hypothetical protein QOD94_929 [Alphaproteobacteria bacterium]|jgi:hypothetical protein|nr:hypothetical protein [Alphaproteobacteria bacterium]
MRVFLVSCLAVVVLALGAVLALNSVQKPTGTRYTTEGARIHPSWSFRQVFSRTKKAPQTVAMAMPTADNVREEGCEVPSAWALILADFTDSPTAEYLCEH